MALTQTKEFAAPPPLRNEISLNGTWSFTPLTPSAGTATIPVPDYWDAIPGFNNVAQARYQRTAAVPFAWAGQRVKVEFEGVCHIADVYVNEQFVGNHVGGWIPFSFDITDKVNPGSSFTLRVDVKNANYPPIIDTNGAHIWPVSRTGGIGFWGIIFDVWLRGYGAVHIEDAFIQTSHRNKAITVDYTLKNAGTTTRTVSLAGDIARSRVVEKTIAGPATTLAPGETKVVRVTGAWSNPALWFPSSPNLYVLTSRVMQGATVLDQEARRFGFREIWIQGNQFMLNGIRANLTGTSLNYFTEHPYKATARYLYMSPQTWPATIDQLFSFNIGLVRLHQAPHQRQLLEIADEKGMLIIAESAVTGDGNSGSTLANADREKYTANTRAWIVPWIKGSRNHPSVIMWSAANEPYLRSFLNSLQSKSLADAIVPHDATRPIGIDGSANTGIPGLAVYNRHYPEGYLNRAWGPVSTWSPGGKLAALPLADKPSGVGEFLAANARIHTRQTKENWKANKWCQGTYSRGLRYRNFTDIRPWLATWLIEETTTSPEMENYRNSFAPVALFDREYDDLGIEPLTIPNQQPAAAEGSVLNRTLILYNDEFSNTAVTIEVQVKSGTKTYATGSKTFALALGEHMDIPISFQTPYVGGGAMDLVLVTRKNGVEKFREAKTFQVTEAGSGASSTVVTIGGGS